MALVIVALLMIIVWLWAQAYGQAGALEAETRRADGLERELVDCQRARE